MTGATVVQVPGPGDTVRDVRISSPDRVMWPQDGVTKLDLARYTVAVADGLLRALGDRPVTLQRFPGGDRRRGVLLQEPAQGRAGLGALGDVHLPLRAQRTPSWSSTRSPTAVWAVQMNTVTFHPWPVRTRGHRPARTSCGSTSTRSPARDFADAVRAAVALRELLAEIGLTGWAKTSGNRGVHVYARVAPDARVPRRPARRHRHRPRARAPAARAGHDRVVEGGARRAGLRRLQPGEPRPDHRVGVQPAAAARRTGVDAGQLGRARRRSTRSDFTVRTVPEPARARGDAWAGMDDAVGDVAPALALWEHGRQRARARGAALPAGLPEDARRAAAGPAEPRQAPDQRKHPVVRGDAGSTAVTGLMTSGNLVRVSLGERRHVSTPGRPATLLRPSPAR